MKAFKGAKGIIPILEKEGANTYNHKGNDPDAYYFVEDGHIVARKEVPEGYEICEPPRIYTVIIPHYKTKITAYCIYKILKHSADRCNIIVVSNSGREGIEYLSRFEGQFKLMFYPENLMQSHGLAFDYAIEHSGDITDYFITLESDSFPTSDGWLDYYDGLIEQGYDMAGSLLQLSGGQYHHPAGAMYTLQAWHEAKQLVEEWNAKYDYYPNMLMKDGFPCHIMSDRSEWNATPMHLFHHSYFATPKETHLENYLPIAQSVFHNGMGAQQESYLTYGQRNTNTQGVLSNFNPSERLIYRMGYEPAQWFSYWHLAHGKKVKDIPTTTEWMPNRVNQQQEGTMTENRVFHIWGVTAYGTSPDTASVQDIIDRKKQITEDLYNSIE